MAGHAALHAGLDRGRALASIALGSLPGKGGRGGLDDERVDEGRVPRNAFPRHRRAIRRCDPVCPGLAAQGGAGAGSARLPVSAEAAAGLPALPLAVATIDVAGQLRERSPVDRAIFGDEAGRLATRFVDGAAGQALLARAVAEGYAEASAWLRTAGGPQRFRVALWRQRGGDRVRLIAVFAAEESGGAESVRDEGGAALPAALRQRLELLARDLRGPIDAVTGLAGELRALAGKSATKDDPRRVAEVASDILAAAWRLRRVAQEVEAAGSGGSGDGSIRVGEVDLARLVRRLIRLARPTAEALGTRIDASDLPAQGRGATVLADERRLWSVVERLLATAVAHAGGRGEVVVRLAAEEAGGGAVLEIGDSGPGLTEAELVGLLGEDGGSDGLSACRRLARECGATLELDTAPGRGLTARLVFPAERCLEPV